MPEVCPAARPSLRRAARGLDSRASLTSATTGSLLDGNHTKGETTMTHAPQITLYGNLGGDPQPRTIPAKTVERAVYDVVSDDVVEREIATPEREVRTFSIAVTGRNADGETVTRWIHCDDWNGHSKDVKKGDRVRVKGFFRERRYDRDGETVTARIFVIKDLAVERHAKPRTEVETGTE
jgi:single-stranded DNA-binding protein